nr:hypothetical protein [uncultured bacterium]
MHLKNRKPLSGKVSGESFHQWLLILAKRTYRSHERRSLD